MTVEEVAEVTAHHRSTWCRCGKSRNGCTCRSPMDDLSVVALINQGYGLTDIGMMFGVSRERVRQIAMRQGRKTAGSLPRVWDDKLNRFRVITRKERDTRRRLIRRALHHRTVRQRREVRRVHELTTLKALAKQLGRVPVFQELVTAVGKSVAGISLDWGKDRKKPGGYGVAMARLYRTAGFEVRGVGYSG
ncbi:hypothetical protein LCGC14_2215670, partial [marine sediment metagenome]